jgi:hypothetical protein
MASKFFGTWVVNKVEEILKYKNNKKGVFKIGPNNYLDSHVNKAPLT